MTETDDRGADGTVTAADVPGAEGELAPQIDQETRTVVIPELQPIRVVSADSRTAFWENLPTGAECRLIEVDEGGANETEILDAEGNVIAGHGEGYTFTVETDPTTLSVDDQPQPSLQVRNTFNLAQVSVTKTVESEAKGIDGEPISYGPFEVTLDCLWNQQQVAAAEPMTQTIADGETVTWAELPAGSECTVAETDAGDADQTTITVDGEVQPGTTGSVTLASGQVTIVFTNTFIAPLPPTGLEGRGVVIALSAGLAVLASGLVLVIAAMRRRRLS